VSEFYVIVRLVPEIEEADVSPAAPIAGRKSEPSLVPAMLVSVNETIGFNLPKRVQTRDMENMSSQSVKHAIRKIHHLFWRTLDKSKWGKLRLTLW
jgi:hypothetical protein